LGLDCLYTTQIRDYHNLFSVTKTLDEWNRKVKKYLEKDKKNKVLQASWSAISGIQKKVDTIFPAWQGRVKWSEDGFYFASKVTELYIAFDSKEKIQGMAITSKEMDQENKVREIELLHLATAPDNLSCVPTHKKVRHVGMALLKAIATVMARECNDTKLELSYFLSAKGFYEKQGFVCEVWDDNGDGYWPVEKRCEFLEKQTESTVVFDEPALKLPQGFTKKNKCSFETKLLEKSVKLISDGFRSSWIQSFTQITVEEGSKFIPRLSSFFASTYSNMFNPDEIQKLLPRLTYISTILTKDQIPEIPEFPALKICDLFYKYVQSVIHSVQSVVHIVKELRYSQFVTP
jgi:hypothetical protein